MPEVPGAAVRATCTRPDGSTAESPVVFVYSPVHCARRHTVDSGPRLTYDYTAQALFADERAARRFETDLLRLRELTAGTSTPRVSAATEAAAAPVTMSGVDRWDAHLADCRRMIGSPLTDLAFGILQIGLAQLPRATEVGDVETEDFLDLVEGLQRAWSKTGAVAAFGCSKATAFRTTMIEPR